MKVKIKQPAIVQAPGEPSPQSLRFIFNLGHLLLVTLLSTWILLFHFYGKPYDNAFIVAASQLLAGRAGGVGLGLRRGFSPGFMLFQTVMVDLILMFYVYPIFVRGYQHLTLVPVVGPYLTNVHKVALSHKKRMAPYGALGLMTFVIFPFWSTGCLVGSIVGYLIGLPTWLSLTSVTVGNIVAIMAWVTLYDRIKEWNETVALIFLLVVFIMAAAGVLFARIRRTQKQSTTEDGETGQPDVAGTAPPATAPKAPAEENTPGETNAKPQADKNSAANGAQSHPPPAEDQP